MNLDDFLPRALYSEYCNADVGYSWFDLPETAKDQWRRVAAFVDRMTDRLVSSAEEES